MTILFDPSRKIKPTTPRTFAAGLALATRERRAPFTVADLDWAAYELNKNARDYNVLLPGPASIRGGAPEPDWDDLADEAMAQDRLDRGLCL